MTLRGVLWGIYVLGFLLNWRRTVWWTATEGGLFEEQNLGVEEIVGGVYFGTMLNTIWPLLVIGRGIRRIYQGHTEGFIKLVTPRHVWRERELRKREERITALEEEVGI